MLFAQRALVGLFVVCGFTSAVAQITGPVPVAWRWVDRIDRLPNGSPIVAGNRVYIAVGARMYCLEKETGNEVWRFPPGEPIDAQFVTNAVLAGDVMVASSDNRMVYAVNTKNGELLWHYELKAAVFAKPVAAGKYVVLPLADNTLLALDSQTGAPLWPEPYSNGSTIYGTLLAWDRYVIFLSGNNTMTALDVLTQKPAYRPRVFTNLSPLSGLSIYSDVLYITSGSYLTSINAATGRIRWEQNIPGTFRFAAAGGPDGVVAVTTDGRMHSFSPAGRQSTRIGFELGSPPVATPTFVGKLVAVSSSNGTLNLYNPFSGAVVWNYTVPPMITGMKILNKPAVNSERPEDEAELLEYVLAAGSPVVSGDMMLVLVQDGSIVSFDKNLGVDLTAPEAKMLWPNSGDQVSGRAPMHLILQAKDDGSGINYDSLEVTINGKKYIHELDRDQNIFIKIITGAKENPPLADGRAVVSVKVKDWMGNSKEINFVLSIDNLLPPLGAPQFLQPKSNVPQKGSGLGGGG